MGPKQLTWLRDLFFATAAPVLPIRRLCLSCGHRHLSSAVVGSRGLLGSLLGRLVLLEDLEVLAEGVFARSLQDGRRLAGHVVLGLVLVAAGVGVLHFFPLLLRCLVLLHPVQHVLHLDPDLAFSRDITNERMLEKLVSVWTLMIVLNLLNKQKNC